jgi:transcriptional regulator with XRE-family HTH domain
VARSETWAQLGAELRSIRTLAGLSQRDVVQRAGISQSSVSRMERGDALPTRAEALAWLTAVEADEEARRRVLALTEAAHTDPTAYQELLRGAGGHLQDQVRQQESTARLVRSFVLTWVPGLLQTAEYARLLIPQADPTGEIDHAAAVAARLDRQKQLFEEGRRFEFLLAEPVLYWSPGAGVMAAQLDRLRSVATLAGVEIGVLPTRRVGALAWHSFTYREPADGADPYVDVELVHGATTTSDPARVQPYVELWDRLWSAAATGQAAIELIDRAGRET